MHSAVLQLGLQGLVSNLASILMTVHLGLLRSLKCRNSNFLGLTQMDNLLKANI